tara:strand:- start:30259 stop:30573 length:315 start_codon:yes stop_codon:yes gene_type:complete
VGFLPRKNDKWRLATSVNIYHKPLSSQHDSFGFDFGGTYTKVVPKKEIAYTLNDNRKVEINFEEKEDTVILTEIFEPESENPVEIQQDGWQRILDSFKKYVESH